jgi:hypothetical protein
VEISPNIKKCIDSVTTKLGYNSNKQTTWWPLGGDITKYKRMYLLGDHQANIYFKLKEASHLVAARWRYLILFFLP